MGEIVICPKCGNELGRIVVIDNVELLQCKALAVRNVDGVCINCGATFNWRYPDRLLRKIIDRSKIENKK